MESTIKQPLEMQENKSITFEAAAKMIKKIDGTQEPFENEALKAHLSKYLDGLNKDYLNLDIIVEKVAKGIYNGKSNHLKTNKLSSKPY